jgi:hypothetical protein
MRDYTFHIEDDRYAIPTLEFVTADSESRARALATQRLQISPHHLAVEVHNSDKLLFRIERPSSPRQTTSAWRSQLASSDPSPRTTQVSDRSTS